MIYLLFHIIFCCTRVHHIGGCCSSSLPSGTEKLIRDHRQLVLCVMGWEYIARSWGLGFCELCWTFSLFSFLLFPKILPNFLFKWPIFLFMSPIFLVSYQNVFHFNNTLPNAQLCSCTATWLIVVYTLPMMKPSFALSKCIPTSTCYLQKCYLLVPHFLTLINSYVRKILCLNCSPESCWCHRHSHMTRW